MMDKANRSTTSRARRLPWRALLLAAALPPLVFSIGALSGGANSLEILAGTRPMALLEIIGGIAYLGGYVGMTLLSPILLIAAILLLSATSLGKVLPRRQRPCER